MRFGTVALANAEGAVLAHSIPLPGGVIKKGTLLGPLHIERLKAAGLSEVMVAQLDPGDVPEDEAARRIAAAIGGTGIHIADAFTGRTNLFATARGVVVINAGVIAALNAIDESITVATLQPYARVEDKQMVATVKIITFAVPEHFVRSAESIARDSAGGSVLRLAPFKARSVALVLTATAGAKASLIAKRARVTGERIASLGGAVISEETVSHTIADVSEAIARARRSSPDCILVFGASAIVDRGDVIPAGVTAAGGTVIHLGMPVDPGNLLMLGEMEDMAIVGVPSCASSPKLNGFDWVLERIMAGLPLGRAEIAAMAVGGLLMEIPTRPQPRQG